MGLIMDWLIFFMFFAGLSLCGLAVSFVLCSAAKDNGYYDNLERNRGSSGQTLCHECVKKLSDRVGLFRLIYELRGEHTCSKCGNRFRVEFVEDEKTVK